jgi:hypothetical protein
LLKDHPRCSCEADIFVDMDTDDLLPKRDGRSCSVTAITVHDPAAAQSTLIAL